MKFSTQRLQILATRPIIIVYYAIRQPHVIITLANVGKFKIVALLSFKSTRLQYAIPYET